MTWVFCLSGRIMQLTSYQSSCEGITLLSFLEDSKIVLHLCQVRDKAMFFLLLLWTCSLSAGLEVGLTGTESSSSSTDSGWGSDQDMWTSATQLEVIRSDVRCSAPYGAVVVMDVWHPAFILPLSGVDRFEATGHDPAASCPWPVKSVLSLITTNIAFYHMIWQPYTAVRKKTLHTLIKNTLVCFGAKHHLEFFFSLNKNPW